MTSVRISNVQLERMVLAGPAGAEESYCCTACLVADLLHDLRDARQTIADLQRYATMFATLAAR